MAFFVEKSYIPAMNAPLRLAFMGTPAFAVPALEALAASGHDIAAVYTQPPRPSGRGQKLAKSPVQLAAEAHGFAVRHPVSLKPQEEKEAFAALALDAAVVAAYGLILPKAILAAPRHGCVNIHGSLLPRWRGAAPIHRALLAGDTETGITIMQMEAGLDTGPMLASESLPIGPRATFPQIHDAMAELGARMIVPVLEGFVAGAIPPVAQDEASATYAAKLTRDEGRLDWTRPATALDLQVRALQPWPGSWFAWRGETYKVGAAEAMAGSGAPGAILDGAMTIACGDGALRLLLVQRPGKAMTDGASFLRGFDVRMGDVLA
jgi:methionyl-tRNA formyltransferase